MTHYQSCLKRPILPSAVIEHPQTSHRYPIFYRAPEEANREAEEAGRATEVARMATEEASRATEETIRGIEVARRATEEANREAEEASQYNETLLVTVYFIALKTTNSIFYTLIQSIPSSNVH